MLDTYNTPYIVFPTIFKPLMARYNKKLLPSERVMFRGQKAWLLDSHALRATQREWSRKRHKTPLAPEAFPLLANAEYYLARGIPNRQVYQWRQRYLHQEMALLRTTIIYWLLQQGCPYQRAFYQPAGQFLGGALSAEEQRIAHRTPEGLIPVVTVHHSAGTATAAWLTLPGTWNGAPVINHVYAPKQSTILGKKDIVERMWAFLPHLGKRHQELQPLTEAQVGNEMYADPEYLDMENGAYGRPGWLEDHRPQRIDPIQIPADPVENPPDLMKMLRHLP